MKDKRTDLGWSSCVERMHRTVSIGELIGIRGDRLTCASTDKHVKTMMMMMMKDNTVELQNSGYNKAELIECPIVGLSRREEPVNFQNANRVSNMQIRKILQILCL